MMIRPPTWRGTAPAGRRRYSHRRCERLCTVPAGPNVPVRQSISREVEGRTDTPEAPAEDRQW